MPKYQLDPCAMALLSTLQRPTEATDVVSLTAARSNLPVDYLEKTFNRLLNSGVLQTASDTQQPTGVSVRIGTLDGHRALLSDTVRMDAFRRAIQAVVKRGNTVIDVGAGTGILSFLAVRAGAAKVWALEATPIINDARSLAVANRMDDAIEFLECDAGNFCSDRPVDAVISGWIGPLPLAEWRLFAAFVKVRDSCLRQGGSVIPQAARLLLAPMSDRRIYQSHGLGFWEEPCSGFDLSLGRVRQLANLRPVQVNAHPGSLIGEPSEMLRLNCLTDGLNDCFFGGTWEIRCPETVTCHGYLGYFEVDLTPDITIDTSPSAPQTHWQQVYFPTKSFQIQRGDTLLSRVRTTRDSATGCPQMNLNVELRRGTGQPLRATYRYSIGGQIMT